MTEPIEDSYFNWLCAKVRKTSFPLYFDLLKIMHQTEFIPLLPGDKNRRDDGMELREDFVRETRFELDPGWEHTECSVLEMLVALSIRASFQTDIPVRDWFWKIVENLQLDEYRRVQEHDKPVIFEILYNLVWRMYDENGQRGMFPMRWPKHEDQRSVEIWIQFCDYVEEEQLV